MADKHEGAATVEAEAPSGPASRGEALNEAALGLSFCGGPSYEEMFRPDAPAEPEAAQGEGAVEPEEEADAGAPESDEQGEADGDLDEEERAERDRVRAFGRDFAVGEEITRKTAKTLAKVDSEYNSLKGEYARSQASLTEMRERLAYLEGSIGHSGAGREPAGAARGAGVTPQPPRASVVDEALVGKFKEETFEGSDVLALVEQSSRRAAEEALGQFKGGDFRSLLVHMAAQQERFAQIDELIREREAQADENSLRNRFTAPDVGRDDLVEATPAVAGVFRDLSEIGIQGFVDRLNMSEEQAAALMEDPFIRDMRFETAINLYERAQGTKRVPSAGRTARESAAEPQPRKRAPAGRAGARVARTQGVQSGRAPARPWVDETTQALQRLMQ